MTDADPTDDDLKAHLRQWQVVPLAGDVSDRLIAAALSHPQIVPWPQRLGRELEQTLTDWKYGMGYKLAAAAACLVLGLGLGIGLEQPTVSIAGIALMSEGMTAS